MHAAGLGGSWLGAGKLAVATANGLALAVGDATRGRRAYLAEERSRRAEQDREREAQRRVTEERLRIARDLHDSLGYRLTLINAQAGMAAHVFEQRNTARQSLRHREAGSPARCPPRRRQATLTRLTGPESRIRGVSGSACPPMRHRPLDGEFGE